MLKKVDKGGAVLANANFCIVALSAELKTIRIVPTNHVFLSMDVD